MERMKKRSPEVTALLRLACTDSTGFLIIMMTAKLTARQMQDQLGRCRSDIKSKCSEIM